MNLQAEIQRFTLDVPNAAWENLHELAFTANTPADVDKLRLNTGCQLGPHEHRALVCWLRHPESYKDEHDNGLNDDPCFRHPGRPHSTIGGQYNPAHATRRQPLDADGWAGGNQYTNPTNDPDDGDDGRPWDDYWPGFITSQRTNHPGWPPRSTVVIHSRHGTWLATYNVLSPTGSTDNAPTPGRPKPKTGRIDLEAVNTVIRNHRGPGRPPADPTHAVRGFRNRTERMACAIDLHLVAGLTQVDAAQMADVRPESLCRAIKRRRDQQNR